MLESECEMSDMNWLELRSKIDAAKSVKEVTDAIAKYGVDVPSFVRQACSKACYDKDYRRGRNQSIAAKDAEIAKLRKQVAAK